MAFMKITRLSRAAAFASGALALLIFALAASRTPISAQNASAGKVKFQVIVVATATEAEQVLARLRQGEDFATVAKQVSIDPSASNGGYFNEVDPAGLRPELREALASLKSGEVSGAIQVPTGFVIVKALAEPQPAGQGMGPGQGAPGQGMGPNRDLHLSAKGAIQYPADVAGQVLADMLFQKYPKLNGWDQDLQGVCTIRKRSLAEGIEGIERLLADPKQMASKTPFDVIQTHYALAQLEAYQGNMDEAVQQWEAAYEVAASDIPAGLPQLTEVLGVAYLHKSQMENGVYQTPGEQCIFPPRENLCYRQTGDSAKAVDYFTKYLELKPERPDIEQVRWLLNLAYMTLGKYPAGVPQRYLIPPSVFESKETIGKFRDVAPASGLGFVSMAGGVVADDFENDGLL
ncbi:MAG TPA: peptidylprolyl isomerase, partial [Candidatus Acidoferrales bacterium]|nr:peptidylprolyl isomerase [Candidatus Acidoferrales bacterium]